ncbi:hypothetical protein MMA231_00945 [Asticcacaulis sp. MM231]|uniref:DUF3164 family protein n=1 Tax=Asticcacaulis sp. MM231 TaxID=3157666 RepID=UPI0032D57985
MDDLEIITSKDALADEMASIAAELDTENAPKLDDGVVEHGGRKYMRLANGGLQLVENIRPQSLLQDQVVRKLIAEAKALSGKVQTFRDHALDEVETFVDVLNERYGAKRGGEKGNVSLVTVDQTMKVERSIGEFIDFGPELESARALFNECVQEWGEFAKAELVSMVNRGFQLSKGKVNRSALLGLLQVQSEDQRWKDAQLALQEAIVVVARKAYPRFYEKDARGKWVAISIDLASGAAS